MKVTVFQKRVVRSKFDDLRFYLYQSSSGVRNLKPILTNLIKLFGLLTLNYF